MIGLWAWHPPVGVWIGVLGLLGVIVPLLRDLDQMSKREKASWTALMFVLLLLEIKSVYQDRNEHDREQAEARAEQLRQFGKIADGNATIVSSDQHFAQTMSRSDSILSRVVDSIRTQTGGDSFAFISFTAEQAASFEMRWNNFVAPRGKPYFLVSISSRGKYPLRGTHAVMMDDERRLAAMQEYNKHLTGDFIQAINSADTEYQEAHTQQGSGMATVGRPEHDRDDPLSGVLRHTAVQSDQMW